MRLGLVFCRIITQEIKRPLKNTFPDVFPNASWGCFEK